MPATLFQALFSTIPVKVLDLCFISCMVMSFYSLFPCSLFVLSFWVSSSYSSLLLVSVSLYTSSLCSFPSNFDFPSLVGFTCVSLLFPCVFKSVCFHLSLSVRGVPWCPLFLLLLLCSLCFLDFACFFGFSAPFCICCLRTDSLVLNFTCLITIYIYWFVLYILCNLKIHFCTFFKMYKNVKGGTFSVLE